MADPLRNPDRIRSRRPEDVPALVDVLAEQQPASNYPCVWPLPFPVRDFIVRPGVLAAWTALRDDRPVGHVCVQRAGGDPGVDGRFLEAWARGHQRPVDELAVVSALFTSTQVRGSGLGGRLLDTAVGWIREHGLGACLDVVPGPSAAEGVYLARGWSIAGEVRPAWLADDMPSVRAMVLRP